MKFFFISVIFVSYAAFAGPTKVGNGDDGADLEDLQLVKSGILLSTRDKALLKVRELNLRSVSGLGYLDSELKNAEIYLSSSDIRNPKEFDKGLEVSKDGKVVYARTLARPHSPVRFFPSALTLSEEQLVRLHIHEALHRALPENIRENESIVSEITLAIMAPYSSRDSVEYTAKKYRDYIPPKPAPQSPPPPPVAEAVVPYKRMSKLSTIRFMYRKVEPIDIYALKLKDILTIEGSYFLNEDDGLGFFASLSLLRLDSANYRDKAEKIGPCGLGVEYVFPIKQEFKLSTALKQFFYVKPGYEMRQDLRFRDLTTLEASIRREVESYFLDGGIRFLFKSQIATLSGTPDGQEYSPITIYHVSAGRKLGPLLTQLKIEYADAEGNRWKEVQGDQYGFNRYVFDGSPFNVRTIRPEISYVQENLRVSIFATLLLDGTTWNYSLDDLGDIGTSGFGKSLYGTSFSYHF